MARQTRGPRSRPERRPLPDEFEPVAAGVRHLKIVFVNAYFVDTPERAPGSWALVDAGLPLTGGMITRLAEKLYGAGMMRGAAFGVAAGVLLARFARRRG